MSREIDLTKPLSDEDRKYLEDRCRWRDIAIADEGSDPGPSLPDDSIVGSQENSPNAEPAHAGAQNPEPVLAPEAALLVGSGTEPPTPPADGADGGDATGNPDADGADTEPDDEDEGDNYDDEEAWTFQDLRTEATGRPGVSAGGSRADIIARLREDDARAESAN